MVKFYLNRIVSLGLDSVEEYEALKGPIPAKWRDEVVAEFNAIKNA